MSPPPVPGPRPVIRSFRDDDLPKVRELFAAGMLEFAGDLEPEFRRYIQESLDDDLSDVAAHYLAVPRSHFWVAEFGGELAGTVGVQPAGDGQDAELRRMSVSSAARRRGIGRMLLEVSEVFCREQGYRRIRLASNTRLEPALAMYRSHGYVLAEEVAYGEQGAATTLTVHHMVKEL